MTELITVVVILGTLTILPAPKRGFPSVTPTFSSTEPSGR
jgi:hypothetical protein